MDRRRIGKRLREMRAAARLTQSDVAVLLDVSHATISHIEHGTTSAPLEKIQAFAEVVGGDARLLISSQSDPRDQLQSRLLAVLPHVPDRQLRAILGLLEVWEEVYLPDTSETPPAR